MTTYVVIEKNKLSRGEPAIDVREGDRHGQPVGTFSSLEIDGPSRIVTYDDGHGVWLVTEASWRGT